MSKKRKSFLIIVILAVLVGIFYFHQAWAVSCSPGVSWFVIAVVEDIKPASSEMTCPGPIGREGSFPREPGYLVLQVKILKSFPKTSQQLEKSVDSRGQTIEALIKEEDEITLKKGDKIIGTFSVTRCCELSAYDILTIKALKILGLVVLLLLAGLIWLFIYFGKKLGFKKLLKKILKISLIIIAILIVIFVILTFLIYFDVIPPLLAFKTIFQVV